MGYVLSNPSNSPDGPTLTDLGVMRPEGVPEDQQDEGLGRIGGRGRARLRRGGRAFGSAAAIRRSRARTRAAPSRVTSSTRRRGLIGRMIGRARLTRRPPTPTTRAPTRRRSRGIFGRMRTRARERATAARAERAAAEALAIAEAERLAREAIIPPTVTDRNGGRPPTIGTALACRGTPPDRRAGWRCFSGRWRYQMPGGGWADQGPQVPPSMPRPHVMPRPVNGAPWPVLKAAPEGTPIARIPTARPWWQAAPVDGEIPMRDTSGIPTPPGLPGGPTMRPPASGPDDTADEVVGAPAAPAAGLDVAKLLPLAAAAAFMFMKK